MFSPRGYVMFSRQQFQAKKTFEAIFDDASGSFRGFGADLVIADPELSRRHARLRVLDGGIVELEDLGSSNGTFVDGTRITSAVMLDAASKIQLGSSELAFESGGSR